MLGVLTGQRLVGAGFPAFRAQQRLRRHRCPEFVQVLVFRTACACARARACATRRRGGRVKIRRLHEIMLSGALLHQPVMQQLGLAILFQGGLGFGAQLVVRRTFRGDVGRGRADHGDGHGDLGRLQGVEHRVVGGLAAELLLCLLLGAQFLGQLRGDLGHVALLKVLHHTFGHVARAMVHGIEPEVHAEPVGVMLQQPDALGVDAGGGQVDDLGDAVGVIGAGGLDVRQVHVGAHVHAQGVRDAVHHLAHAEASGSSTQVQCADAHDNAGLGGEAGLGDRLVPVASNVFHVKGNGVGVEMTHRRRRVLMGRVAVLVLLHVLLYPYHAVVFAALWVCSGVFSRWLQ